LHCYINTQLIWIGWGQGSDDWDECEIALFDARLYPDHQETIIMPALTCSSLCLTPFK
jgi:hypothetical protein